MRWLATLALALTLISASPLCVEPAEEERITARQDQPFGIDVSSWQGDINWGQVVSYGVVFAIMKATEGTNYTSPYFSSQYTGAANAGIIRGAYHFALPDRSSGAAQATYFLAHGGGWSADGITLPGALDIEYNPYGAACYGLSQSAMVSWIRDFSNTYLSSTGRYPMIYTSTNWWRTCTGDNSSFGSNNPLWIASWGSSIGILPAGWQYATFWQYADSGPVPGDQNVFNGDMEGLRRMARGS